MQYSVNLKNHYGKSVLSLETKNLNEKESKSFQASLRRLVNKFSNKRKRRTEQQLTQAVHKAISLLIDYRITKAEAEQRERLPAGTLSRTKWKEYAKKTYHYEI